MSPGAVRHRRLEEGFTLIELLIVVLVIAVLAAIAVPAYLGVQSSAKDAGVKADLMNAKTALAAWSSQNGGAVPAQAGFDPAGLGLTRYGWSQSGDTVSLVYSSPSASTWCVLGTGSTGKRWAISSGTEVTGGLPTSTCPSPL